MPSWLDLLMGGQAPQFPQGQQPPQLPFVPQQMAIAPTFAQAPQMAQDVAAGIADPLLKAGNYLGGIMQGSQQFSWPETIQHGAALAMAMAPGPKGERIAAGAERGLARTLGESAAGQLAGQVKPPIDVGTVPGGIRAYHGSPYDFPAFDISKIGTGEGAQAYGHGLYFAENQATAKAYRDQLAASRNNPDLVRPDEKAFEPYKDRWDQLVQTTRKAYDEQTKAFAAGDVEKAKQLQSVYANAQNEMDAIHANMVDDTISRNPHLTKGRMYEVNIKAQPEQFLDFDKPFGDQSPTVQKAITDLWTAKGGKLEGRTNPPFVASTNTGEAIHAALATTYGQGGTDAAAAAQALHEAGIPGIRYLDQGSRTDARAIETLRSSLESVKSGGQRPFETAAEYNGRLAQAESDLARAQNPTRNYVVFNDKLIDILRKYGLIGALGGSMSAPYFAPQGQQQ